MATNIDTSKYFRTELSLHLKYWNRYALDITSAELAK